MKKIKLILASIMVVSFAACSSSGGGGHDKAPNISGGNVEQAKYDLAIINSKNNIEKLDSSKLAKSGENIVGKTGTFPGIGIAANGGGAKATNDGTAETSDDAINYGDVIGVAAINGGQAINTGTLNMKGNSNIGIYANGASANNSEVVNINGKNSAGMVAMKNAAATNSKEIKVTGEYSTGITAIYKTGRGTNMGVINVNANNSDGMEAEFGATIENRAGATINVSGNQNIGMEAYNGGQAINNGTIAITGSKNIGMLADGHGSKVTNNGVIMLSGKRKTGTGNIDNSTGASVGVDGFNKSLGTDMNGNIGIQAKNGGSFVNKGRIEFKK